MGTSITNSAPARSPRFSSSPNLSLPCAALAFAWLLLACGGNVLEAQTAPPVMPAQASPSMPEAGTLVVGPGDLLNVNVFATPELSGSFRVDQAGKIALPVGGDLEVNGLTSAEVARLLETRLKERQIMLDPHVTIFVSQYATQGVTILGEVKTPGIYPLFGAHSLYDAVSVAGGSTQVAGDTITITHRRNPESPVVVNVTASNYSTVESLTPILPGDTIFVSKADYIFVVGDAKLPGQYPIASGKKLSVLNVLALCQGVNRTAKVTKAAIVRPTASGGADTIPLDLDKIMRNEAPNLVLEASDVLVIPRSGLKTFLEYALPAATTTVVSSVATALIVK